MPIGERIRQLRVEQKITQAELAEKLVISQSMLCQIERGTKACSVPVGMDIAKILGVTLNDLVDNERKVG